MAGKASNLTLSLNEGDIRALLLDHGGNLRITGRPSDCLGAYRVTTVSGLVAAGSGGPKDIWAFRTGATNPCIIRRVTFSMWDVTTGFTAGLAKFDLFVARSFSASYTTNGTAATLTGNNGKKKTAGFATTSVAQIYTLGTNINGITGATRTLDAQALASLTFQVTATANAVLQPTTELVNFTYDNSAWPLVLGANEGLVLQSTVPATGTWTFQVSIEWEEVEVAP